MPQPPHRLDTAMNRRRIELGLSWRDVAADSGISYETLRAVSRGANTPGPLTKRGIETALRWRTGSIDAVLEGGASAPLEDQGGGSHAADAQLDAIVALFATLPPDVQDEVVRRSQRQGPRTPSSNRGRPSSKRAG